MEDLNPDSPKFHKALNRAFDAHTAAALIHVEPFAQLLMDNPDKAIDDIFNICNKALNEAYTDESEENVRAFIQSIAGGPCEIIPHQLYNAVGAVYPYLDRPQKDRALGGILDILDRINFQYVNTAHTPGIREPTLLADIAITRAMYWPGLYEGKTLLERFPDFSELQEELIDERGMFKRDKVASDFVVAYSLLRSDFCDYGKEYVSIAEPNFLGRTMKGIVAIRFARAQTDEQIEQGTKRLQELLPKSMHGSIESIRIERDWVDYEKFT